MVKVLGISGSPHRLGGTEQLLRCALNAADENGADTNFMRAYDGEIKPCIGCIHTDEPTCRFPCIFEDHGKTLLLKIHESDVIIFATPVYWYGPSGQIKNLVDRMTCMENMTSFGEPSYMEGKVIGVITVGSDAGLVFASAHLMTALNGMGAVVPPWAYAYSDKGDNAIFDDAAVMDAINVGKICVSMAQTIKSSLEKMRYREDKGLMEKIRQKIVKNL